VFHSAAQEWAKRRVEQASQFVCIEKLAISPNVDLQAWQRATSSLAMTRSRNYSWPWKPPGKSRAAALPDGKE